MEVNPVKENPFEFVEACGGLWVSDRPVEVVAHVSNHRKSFRSHWGRRGRGGFV